MNKYLIKAARFSEGLKKVKNFVTDSRTVGAAVGGSIGAAAGSTQGLKTHEQDFLGNPKRKFTAKERKHHAIAGSITGGVIGGFYGYQVGRGLKGMHGYRQQNNYGGGGGRYSGYKHSSRGIDDIYKDLDATGQFRTKHEAKTHYRRMASKHHPDRFINPHEKVQAEKKMSKINAAWDEFHKHPNGFEKLANSYLTKVAAVDWVKAKQFVKENPGATIGAAIFGSEGLSSTTRKHNEHPVRFRLRQIKNTTVGVAAGAGTGKLAQEGFTAIMKK